MNVIISLLLAPQATLVAHLSANSICVLIPLDGAQRNEPQNHIFAFMICTEITDSTRQSVFVGGKRLV